jgi:hypothetical protein
MELSVTDLLPSLPFFRLLAINSREMNVRVIFAIATVAVFYAPLVRTTGKQTDAVPSNRFEKLWLVTYVNDEGVEAVAEAKIATGQTVPLIAADSDRLESIIEIGKALAAARKMKMRLVQFSGRTDVGEFSP